MYVEYIRKVKIFHVRDKLVVKNASRCSLKNVVFSSSSLSLHLWPYIFWGQWTSISRLIFTKIYVRFVNMVKPRLIFQYSNMAPRLFTQTFLFGGVFFVSRSLLGMEGLKELTKFAISVLKASKPCFTITAQILAPSFANFYRQ